MRQWLFSTETWAGNRGEGDTASHFCLLPMDLNASSGQRRNSGHKMKKIREGGIFTKENKRQKIYIINQIIRQSMPDNN